MQAVERRNRRYLVIKGGLAWLLWQVGGVVNTVDVLGSSGVGLGVYRRRRGGRNSKYGVNTASQNITRQYAVLGVT